MNNLEKYKKDLEKLIKTGDKMLKVLDGDNNELLEFIKYYEIWYSEALSVVSIVLPKRNEDFKKYYEDPKNSNNLKTAIYHGGINRVKRLFTNQLNILKSCKKVFESSLFEIKQLLQADLFDNQLDVAEELNKKDFTRGAGVVTGVVLEGHLLEICGHHNIKVNKKNPTITILNDLLKNNSLIEVSVFRKIQFLADIRNKCVHKKEIEPKKEEIEELIAGVKQIIKSVF